MPDGPKANCRREAKGQKSLEELVNAGLSDTKGPVPDQAHSGLTRERGASKHARSFPCSRSPIIAEKTAPSWWDAAVTLMRAWSGRGLRRISRNRSNWRRGLNVLLGTRLPAKLR